MNTGASHAVFGVLMVCTANVYRSPTAERLLRERLDRSPLHWRVESAGTHARDGEPMHPQVNRALTERRIASPDWRSTRLTRDVIARANLILTAERTHRRAVVELAPETVGRAFTLLQFARFAAEMEDIENVYDSYSTGEALIMRAIRTRATLQPVDPSRDELPDPIGQRRRVYRECVELIDTALATILAPLASVGEIC